MSITSVDIWSREVDSDERVSIKAESRSVENRKELCFASCGRTEYEVDAFERK